MNRFELSKIRILDGEVLATIRVNDAYMDSLDLDRLLYAYFAPSGKKPKAAAPYGGWENMDSETHISGHTLGHLLSAMSMRCAAEGLFREKIGYIVSELASCQLQDGYLFTKPASIFDKLERGEGGGNPYYVMHKTFAGLFDAWRFAGNQLALEVLKKAADWLCARMSALTPEVKERVLTAEYGGMNEVLYQLYEVTKEQTHLRAARCFEQREMLKALASRRDILSGNHANTMIPKLVGSAKGFFVTGERMLLDAARNFWDLVVEEGRTFATGGNAESEHFADAHTLSRQIYDEPQETCNVYNMLKLTAYLFEATGEARYAEYAERALLNAILGSIDEGGTKTYFQFLHANAKKIFHSPQASFWCCCGTGMESFSKLQQLLCFEEGESIFFTIYQSLSLEHRAFRLSEEVDPWRRRADFTVHAGGKRKLCFRIPQWASSVRLTLNGESADFRAEQGFLCLSRQFVPGDRIAVEMEAGPRAVTTTDDSRSFSLCVGPFVLAAVGNRFERMNLLKGSCAEELAGKLRKTDEGYELETEGERLQMIPYAKVERNFYNVCFRLTSDYPAPDPAMRASVSSSAGDDGELPNIQESWLIRGFKPNLYLLHDGYAGIDRNGSQGGEFSMQKWGRFDHYAMDTGSVEYRWETPQRVSGVRLFFGQNTDDPHQPFVGDHALPAAGKLFGYEDNRGWTELASFRNLEDFIWESRFGTCLLRRLKLELEAQPGKKIGIQEWKVLND